MSLTRATAPSAIVRSYAERNILALACAVTSAILGLVVLLGWYTHCLALLRIQDGWVAMAANTAVGFLSAGLALAMVVLGRFRIAVIGGAVCFAIGVATLSEYSFHLNLGIDQLLVRDYAWASVISPGRMAFCSALNFSLIGIAIFLNAPGRSNSSWRNRLTGLTGALIVGLGVIALSGYFSGVTLAYTWGLFTRMAVHTTLGFLVVGLGIIAYAWRERQRPVPDWLPGLVGISGATASLCLWQALVVGQRQQLQLLDGLEHATRSIQLSSLIRTQHMLTDGALSFGLALSALLAGVVYFAQSAAQHASDAEAVNRQLGAMNASLQLEIAERALIEGQLEAARDALERRVNDRTAELILANRELEEAHRVMQETAAKQREFMGDILTSVTEGKLRVCRNASELPHMPDEAWRPVPLNSENLHILRRRTLEAAQFAGLVELRANDLVTAVGEAAMNAIVHGGGGEGRVHLNESGVVQVWITDEGRGIEIDSLHQATLRRGFTTTGSFGHGFWLMLQVVDRVWLLTGPNGTTVVLEQHRDTADLFIESVLGLAA